jgi:hypothetical protein
MNNSQIESTLTRIDAAVVKIGVQQDGLIAKAASQDAKIASQDSRITVLEGQVLSANATSPENDALLMALVAKVESIAAKVPPAA